MTDISPIRRIRPLPEVLANQIAAGEVVERPASVVKELLENSLDAGATRIDVEVEEGGLRLLRVRDDGAGIHPDDLALALARHATSKIATLDELEGVVSLGFRGEALPSIGSVARLTLASRLSGGANAWRVTCDGGRLGSPEPDPLPRGTVVEVRDLFFNTPARRKFLRSPRTELGHVQEACRRVALSHPRVAVRLRHGDRDLLTVRASAGDPGRRVAAVCGDDFMEQALVVDWTLGTTRLWGWVGPRSYSRAQADVQYVFLNGRAVKDRVVSHAARQAYRDATPPGRSSAYVLYLEMAPEAVDVNVHPAKAEVRFREPRAVHDLVYGALTRALDGTDPAMDLPAEASGAVAPAPGPSAPRPRAGYPGNVREAATRYLELVRHGADAGRAGPVRAGSFLAAPHGDGLLLVDMPRVASRLAYRALAGGPPVPSRPLVIPAVVALSTDQAAVVEAAAAPLAGLGLEVCRTGPGAVTVRRVPGVLHRVAPEALVRAVASLPPASAVDPNALAGALAGCAAEAAQAELDDGELAQLAAGAPGLDPGASSGEGWRVLGPAELGRLLAGDR